MFLLPADIDEEQKARYSWRPRIPLLCWVYRSCSSWGLHSWSAFPPTPPPCRGPGLIIVRYNRVQSRNRVNRSRHGSIPRWIPITRRSSLEKLRHGDDPVCIFSVYFLLIGCRDSCGTFKPLPLQRSRQLWYIPSLPPMSWK